MNAIPERFHCLPWFYYPGHCFSGQRLELDVEESRHLAAARRLQRGEEVCLFNGAGQLARAAIEQCEGRKRSSQLLIAETIEVDASSKNRIHLYCALPKNDRLATMLDMVTQIGIAGFTPLACEYSVNRWRHNHQNRSQRIVREACKQSHQAFVPELYPEITLSDFLDHFRA